MIHLQPQLYDRQVVENTSVFIQCHQGLGDHLICNGIYLNLAMNNSFVLIPVRKRYESELEKLIKHAPNIKTISYPDFYFTEMTIAHGEILANKGFKILKLGYFNKKYLELADRFDESFYVQANLDFRHRWDSFAYSANRAEEEHVFRELVGNKDSFAFLHDDINRGFQINESLVSPDLEIIRPNRRKTSIFDYRLVIERATEIHCIESSFSVFIDNLGVSAPKKFIHRYARPEAINDKKHEASYKSNWKIFSNY